MIQVKELARKERIVVISRQAMLITAIPVVVLSVIGMVGIIWTARTYSYELAQLPYIFAQLLSAALCLMWFVLAIILTIIERINPRTVGIWFGVGIGIVSLIISVGLAPGLM